MFKNRKKPVPISSIGGKNSKKVWINSEAFVQRWPVKKGVLTSFAKFTEKHLHWGISFNRVTGLRSFHVDFAKNFKSNYFVNRLWTAVFQNHIHSDSIVQWLTQFVETISS